MQSTRLGVWSLGYGFQFQVWDLQARMPLKSMFGIQSQACIQSQSWFCITSLVLAVIRGFFFISSLVFNPNVGFESQVRYWQ